MIQGVPIIYLNKYQETSFPTVAAIDHALEKGNRELDHPESIQETPQKLAKIIQITRFQVSKGVQ